MKGGVCPPPKKMLVLFGQNPAIWELLIQYIERNVVLKKNHFYTKQSLMITFIDLILIKIFIPEFIIWCHFSLLCCMPLIFLYINNAGLTILFIVFASSNESAGFIKFSTNYTCHSTNAILHLWISCRPGRNKYMFSFFRFICFTFSLFVISTLRFSEFVKKQSMMVLFLNWALPCFSRRISNWRDSLAMNQCNGNQQFLPNNVIGCYTYSTVDSIHW